MKRFTGAKGALILMILVVAMVSYYAYLSNKSSRQAEADVAVTKVQKMLMRDLQMNYPPTPKEVVKCFGDITLCLYDGSCEDSDVDKLAAQLVQLYDQELVDNNPWADYIVNLKNDIASYEEKQTIISRYEPAGSSSVDFYTRDGFSWARLYCTFYTKQEKSNNSQAVAEVFLLRKDEDGRWKIYGWDLAKNVNQENQDQSAVEVGITEE